MEITLRPYQNECLEAIASKPPGSYLCNLATGMGKTVILTHIPRHGRVLLLAHREELVRQPIKYFDCPVGVEMAKETSHGEEVVIASVQSLVRRLDKFNPNDFWMIITDECHHSSSKTYRKIYDYFNFQYHIGFTATVNRSDGVRLDNVFSEIIFQRDLRWGIENGYLSPIHALRVTIDYSLDGVKTQNGDYAPGELDERMEGTEDAIAQAYREHAQGATLIFAASVRHAEEIARRIPGARVVTGETKNRAEIIDGMTKGEIPCIVNCMVFTEGTDIPRVETVILARPTKSDALYCQEVGRGLRLFPGKKQLILIDCVDVTQTASLCTAPSLLGIDLEAVPKEKREEMEGDLFEMPDKARALSDTPESWIKNVQIVDLWAKQQRYQLHDINFFKMPTGELVVSLLDNTRIRIPAPDSLGMIPSTRGPIPMQEAIDLVYRRLQNRYQEQSYLWDRKQMKKWDKKPASEKQKELIKRMCKDFEGTDDLSKGEASMILNRLFAGKSKGKRG